MKICANLDKQLTSEGSQIDSVSAASNMANVNDDSEACNFSSDSQDFFDGFGNLEPEQKEVENIPQEIDDQMSLGSTNSVVDLSTAPKMISFNDIPGMFVSFLTLKTDELSLVSVSLQWFNLAVEREFCFKNEDDGFITSITAEYLDNSKQHSFTDQVFLPEQFIDSISDLVVPTGKVCILRKSSLLQRDKKLFDTILCCFLNLKDFFPELLAYIPSLDPEHDEVKLKNEHLKQLVKPSKSFWNRCARSKHVDVCFDLLISCKGSITPISLPFANTTLEQLGKFFNETENTFFLENCVNCFKIGIKERCKECLLVYCSKRCMKYHKERHKKVCDKVKDYREAFEKRTKLLNKKIQEETEKQDMIKKLLEDEDVGKPSRDKKKRTMKNHKKGTKKQKYKNDRAVEEEVSVELEKLKLQNKAMFTEFKKLPVEELNCRKEEIFGVRGICGLRNLGNTCYMNSTLQCLLHTMPLVHFFLKRHYKESINIDNPMGLRGKLVKTLANVYSQVYLGSRTVFIPSDFKKVMARLPGTGGQFEGFEQHDAQELVTFLVDALHEELNAYNEKPFVQNPSDSDEENSQMVNLLDTNSVKISETLFGEKLLTERSFFWRINELRRDRSFISRLFSGQTQTTVRCSNESCQKESVSFSPFMSLPLSVPRKEIEHIYEDDDCIAVFLTLFVWGASTSRDTVCDTMSNEGKQIEEVDLTQEFSPCFIYPNDITEGRPRSKSTTTQTKQSSQLFIPESVCSLNDTNLNIEPRTFTTTKMLRVALTLNSSATVGDFAREISVGIEEDKFTNLTFLKEQLQNTELTFEYFLRHREQPLDNQTKLDSLMERDTQTKHIVLNAFVTLPTVTPVFDFSFRLEEVTGIQNLQEDFYSLYNGPIHSTFEGNPSVFDLKRFVVDFLLSFLCEEVDTRSLNALFTAVQLELFLAENSSIVVGAQSDNLFITSIIRENYPQLLFTKRIGVVVTLKGDILSQMNYFSKYQQDISQDITFAHELDKHSRLMRERNRKHYDSGPIKISSCFDSFIRAEQLDESNSWFCSKCKQFSRAVTTTKLRRLPEILVIYLKRFDLTQTYGQKIQNLVEFPIRGLDLFSYLATDVLNLASSYKLRTKYDLYAVTNHYGSLYGGHYTAFAKTNDTTEGKARWHLFNDSNVTLVEESEVQTSAAYVLYFQKR